MKILYVINSIKFEHSFAVIKDCALGRHWYVLQQAFSLCPQVNYMKKNVDELYNTIVCKVVGGKRINYSLKESFQTPCEVAAISFNSTNYYGYNLV